VTAWDVTLRIADRRTGRIDGQTFQTVAIDDEHHILKIGSSPLADVTLEDDRIAPVHCRLIVNDVGFSWLRPESALLGLLVNGAVVTDTVRFGVGDRLELGDRTITLARDPATSEMTWKLAFDVRERGEATPDRRVFHSEQVIVGRTSVADLALQDGNVSRRHCMFYMDGSGQLRLKDLGSTNGMWVNGARAADIAFHVGDELFAGNWIIRLAEAPRRVPA
jgi:pSer/pThr/pTyr-binding forkhead associated (FHA) protein